MYEDKMVASYEELKPYYDDLIKKMVVKETWIPRIDSVARRIITNKERYKTISDECGGSIPWQFIGIIHYRESNCNFDTHLHNGDSLRAKTHHVPAGRPLHAPRNGSVYEFEESAVDALQQKSFEKIPQWPLTRIAYELEKYNGWGYRMKGLPSPYLWSGSNDYVQGKYIADGVFDPHEVDKQLGCMVILNRIMALDVSEKKLYKLSRKLSVIRNVKAWGTTTFGSYFTLDYFNLLPDAVKNFQTLGLSKQAIALIALSVVAWFTFSFVEYLTFSDHKNGNYTPSGASAEEGPTEDVTL